MRYKTEATKENIDEFDYVRILNSYVENKHHKVKKTLKRASKPEGEEKQYT